ncbi:MAG TPA: orotidine-5'-phosphate decarboxylase [Bacteroidetes bacterium]|nr:orotidine-5'-phosphate decarboxylase [Bacteroidota bacterium]
MGSKTYKERSELVKNQAAKKLLQLMDDKQTNLALANDETNLEKFLELADKIGPEIAILKTHIDAVEDFMPDVTKQLTSLAKQHNFMIFEDRKFADIGNTVKLQYAKGIYKIIEWADFTNAHIVPGPGIIEGLKDVADEQSEPRGLILLAQMSSKGNLATEEYAKQAVTLAEQYFDFVIGFIGNGGQVEELKKLTSNLNSQFIVLTPGVKLGGGGDALKQQYTTPADVISAGSDVIIVGRGIYGADDPLASAQEHRRQAWEAYQIRLGM